MYYWPALRCCCTGNGERAGDKRAAAGWRVALWALFLAQVDYSV